MSVAKNKIIIQFIITLISVLLLIFIMSKADWSNFNRVKIDFQPLAVIFAIFSVVTVFFLRTMTIFLFQQKPVTNQFQAFLLPSSKYQLLSLVAPMRGADLLLPFMLKTATNTGVGHHYLMVYISRLTDLLVLFSIFILASKLIVQQSDIYYDFVLYVALAFTILIYFYPYTILEASLKILNNLFSCFNRHPAIFDKISSQINTFRKNFSSLDMAFIAVSIVLTWLFLALMFYYIFIIFDFRISFFETLFCVAMINIASLIPMQAFGGIGLRESALLLGLLMLGYSVEMGAVYAVTVRLTALLLQLAVFFSIFLLLSMVNRTNKINT